MARTALLVCGVLALAGCATVPPTQSWAELGRRVAPGTPVAVTDASGAEVAGTIAAFSSASLDLTVGGARRQFSATEVRQVRRNGDPLWNGLLIGLGIGVVGAALPDNKCSGQPPVCDDRQWPQRAAFLGLATAAGVGIDALVRDQRLLFTVPGQATLRVVPGLTPGRAGLTMVIDITRR